MNLLTTSIGSGTIPHLVTSPSYDVQEGTYPVPDQRHGLRIITGEGAVILNPQDFSINIGIRSQAIAVAGTATPLPASPLEFRRALVVQNNSSAVVYLGDSTVTVGQGMPLAAGEKIAFDIMGMPNTTIYAISSGSVDVRIMELA